MKKTLDSLDKKLVAALTGNGQQSVGKLAELLSVTAPTVRSRVRKLVQAGVLMIGGMINPTRTQGITVALVGITLKAHKQLDEKLEMISNLNRVNWAAVVTGRYDIIVEIVCSNDISDLYDFLDKDLSQVGGVTMSESFVVMKSKRKWLNLPDALVKTYQE